MPALKIAIAELVIVALGSAFIIIGYFWADQRGWRTYSILNIGLAIVAVASAWAVRRATSNLGLRGWPGLMVTGCCAGLAVFATLCVSFLVLLNKLGS